jgi:hypothetical protein
MHDVQHHCLSSSMAGNSHKAGSAARKRLWLSCLQKYSAYLWAMIQQQAKAQQGPCPMQITCRMRGTAGHSSRAPYTVAVQKSLRSRPSKAPAVLVWLPAQQGAGAMHQVQSQYKTQQQHSRRLSG